MHVNQKILELVGLLQAIHRLEEDPDDQAELLEVNVKKRNEILQELTVAQINDTGFLTPDEKGNLFEIKSNIG